MVILKEGNELKMNWQEVGPELAGIAAFMPNVSGTTSERIWQHTDELIEKGWKVLGSGYYSTVFEHPKFPEVVIKAYNPKQFQKNHYYQPINDGIVLADLQELLEVPRLYESTMNGVLMSRAPGMAVEEISESEISDQIEEFDSQIEVFIEECIDRGWVPMDLHSGNVWISKDRLFFIDFNCFIPVETFYERQSIFQYKEPKEYAVQIWDDSFQNLRI